MDPSPRDQQTELSHLAYGTFAYAVFGVALVWAFLFLTGLGRAPLIDRTGASLSWRAIGVNLVLLTVFALQHSVMARAAFKRWLTRVVPTSAERSTYVLLASATLLLLFWQWQPMSGIVWEVHLKAAALLIAGLSLVGWLALFASTFMIDHLDLFGLRQSWLGARHQPYISPRFTRRWLYSLVRHPIMTSFLIIFWAAPRMTLGHLLFSLAASAYILVGIWFEERDLLRSVPEYGTYKREVGGLLPRLQGLMVRR